MSNGVVSPSGSIPSSPGSMNDIMMAEVSSINILFDRMKICQNGLQTAKQVELEKSAALCKHRTELGDAQGRLNTLQSHVHKYKQMITDVEQEGSASVSVPSENENVVTPSSVTPSSEEDEALRDKSLELQRLADDLEQCLSKKNALLKEVSRTEECAETLRKTLYDASDALVAITSGDTAAVADGKESPSKGAVQEKLAKASALRKTVLQSSSELDRGGAEYIEANGLLETARVQLEGKLTAAGYGVWLAGEEGVSATATTAGVASSAQRRDMLTRVFVLHLNRAAKVHLNETSSENTIKVLGIQGEIATVNDGVGTSTDSTTSVSYGDVLSGSARVIRHAGETAVEYLLRLQRRLSALQALENNCKSEVEDSSLDVELAEEELFAAQQTTQELKLEENLLERLLQEGNAKSKDDNDSVNIKNTAAKENKTGESTEEKANDTTYAAQHANEHERITEIQRAPDAVLNNSVAKQQPEEQAQSHSKKKETPQLTVRTTGSAGFDNYSPPVTSATPSTISNGSTLPTISSVSPASKQKSKQSGSDLEASTKDLIRVKTAAEYWAVKAPPAASRALKPEPLRRRDPPKMPIIKTVKPVVAPTAAATANNSRRVADRVDSNSRTRSTLSKKPSTNSVNLAKKQNSYPEMAKIASRLEELAQELAGQKALTSQAVSTSKDKRSVTGNSPTTGLPKSQSMETLSASRDLLTTLETQQLELERMREAVGTHGGNKKKEQIKEVFLDLKKSGRAMELYTGTEDIGKKKVNHDNDSPYMSLAAAAPVEDKNPSSRALDTSIAVQASDSFVFEEFSSSDSDAEPSQQMLARQAAAARQRELRQSTRAKQQNVDKSILGKVGHTFGIKTLTGAGVKKTPEERASLRRTNTNMQGLDMDALHDDIGVARVTEEEIAELKRQDAEEEERMRVVKEKEEKDRLRKRLEEEAIAMINAAALEAAEALTGSGSDLSITSSNNYGLDDEPEWASSPTKDTCESQVDVQDAEPVCVKRTPEEEAYDVHCSVKHEIEYSADSITEEPIKTVHSRYLQQINRQIEKVADGANVTLSSFIRPLSGEAVVVVIDGEHPNAAFVRKELCAVNETLALLRERQQILDEHERMCAFTGIALTEDGLSLGLLQLTILNARGLPPARRLVAKTADPYVEVDIKLADSAFSTLGEAYLQKGESKGKALQEWEALRARASPDVCTGYPTTQRTEVRPKTLYPEWRDAMVFAPVSSMQQHLVIRIKDSEGGYKADTILAESFFPLHMLHDQCVHRFVIPLFQPKTGPLSVLTSKKSLYEDCTLRVEAKMVYSKAKLNAVKVREAEEKIRALEKLFDKLPINVKETAAVDSPVSVSVSAFTGKSSRYKYRYAGISSGAADTDADSMRGRAHLRVRGLREKVEVPFGLVERNQLSSNRHQGFFGPPSPNRSAPRAFQTVSASPIGRAQSAERGRRRIPASSPLRDEIMASKRGFSAPGRSNAPISRTPPAVLKHTAKNDPKERRGFGSGSTTGRLTPASLCELAATPLSPTRASKSKNPQSLVKMKSAQLASSARLATPTNSTKTQGQGITNTASSKYSVSRRLEVGSAKPSSTEKKQQQIMEKEKREQAANDLLDAEREADAIIERAQTKARQDAAVDGDNGKGDDVTLQEAIANEMLEAEEAAKKHADQVRYMRTFRGAYSKVPPSGMSARERIKKNRKSPSSLVKGAKNKGQAVFGSSGGRF